MKSCLVCKKNKRKKAKDSQSGNGGSWAIEENLAYAIFIDINKKSMTSKIKMRQMNFYDKLAAFVGTRSSAQCRSHHQKLFQKYKYISKTIQVFKLQVGISTYKLKFAQGQQKMDRINREFEQNALQEHSESCQHEPQPIQRIQPVQEPMPTFTVPQSLSFGYVMYNMGWMPLTFNLTPLMPTHWPI